MHHHSITGANLRHSHPAVFLEVRRNNDVLIRHVAGCGNLFRDRHLKNRIRLFDVPSLRPMNRGRRITRIARRCVCVCPSGKRGDLLRGERRIV